MSKQIEDGGPAFPLPRKYTEPGNDIAYHEDFGMTLRDYFAAQALIAIQHDQGSSFAAPVKTMGFDVQANSAYAMADAMLRARKAGAQ